MVTVNRSLARYSDKVPPAIHVIARGMATEIREGRGPIQLDLTAVPATDREMWLNAFKHIAELARRSGQGPLRRADAVASWF